MAYLLSHTGGTGGWSAIELPSADSLLLHAPGNGRGSSPAATRVPAGAEDRAVSGAATPLALIVPWACSGTVRYAHLRLGPQAYRNDDVVPIAELTVLEHGDALAYLVDDAVVRIFFDATSLAQVEPNRCGETRCAFCDEPVKEGEPSVRCPSCGLVLHQSDERGCWLASGPKCPNCEQETSLERDSWWLPTGFQAPECGALDDDVFDEFGGDLDVCANRKDERGAGDGEDREVPKEAADGA